MTEPVKLSSEDYALWRHHPVSKVFLQFMSDYANTLEREALDRWRSGTLKLIDEQEMRGRVLTLRELTELPLEAVKAFYQKDEAEQ